MFWLHLDFLLAWAGLGAMVGKPRPIKQSKSGMVLLFCLEATSLGGQCGSRLRELCPS